MENEFEKIEKALYSEAQKIKPSPEGLRAVLDRIGENVTEKNSTRYNLSEDNKGRAFGEDLFEIIHHTMNNFWKIVLPVGAVVVIALLIGYGRFGFKPSADQIAPVQQKQASSESIEFASDEINSEIEGLINDEVGDSVLAELDTADETLADYDKDALASFDNLAYYYE